MILFFPHQIMLTLPTNINDMKETLSFSHEELQHLSSCSKRLLRLLSGHISTQERRQIQALMTEAYQKDMLQRDSFGLNPILFDVQTSQLMAEEVGISKVSIISILLHRIVAEGCVPLSRIRQLFGEDVGNIIKGLLKVNELYAKNPSIETENFRDLLLSFAEDMRVIFIIIADRVNLMRQIKDKGTDSARVSVSQEAKQLYAPLAHKLGLYVIKSELEDLSLKYLDHDAYYLIKEKLNATKKSRDLYIARFIQPIEELLKVSGVKFHVKGRTKSIYSIWQKMRKQKCQFEGVYDLFAIRIILDSPLDKEKQQCWQVYSIVTDKYKPNPKRLRDWLSVPKSNGYESLHTTVMGPDGKWVEIQIRTERMDEIAEHGLAAHWRYKGVKDGGAKLDGWLADIRSALESHAHSDEQLVDQFKVDLYSDEVFVFTPKGDLFKLPKGATVLDFAFQIHSNIGCHCTGARVNGKNVSVRTKLSSGDQVEILTSPNQSPRRDWLNSVITSKAKNKIKQSLNEEELKIASIAKEAIERKLKNRKIEYDEATMMRLIKKMGYKYVNEFFRAIAEDVLDINNILDRYTEDLRKESEQPDDLSFRSAGNYIAPNASPFSENKDELIIDKNVKGVEYSLAKCCNPIYGDEIFGFVTINRGIKIHRKDCPNAKNLRENKSYRVIRAKWAGKGNSQYPITLRVVGVDDIGIVNNITSIINKEKNVLLRSISIDSSDGLFQGTLTVMLDDNNKLKELMKKLRTVKGVKDITR